MGARYFLEIYLWTLPLVAVAVWSPVKSFLFKLMVGQILIMSLIACFGAVTLFPGALTASLREKVMKSTAFGYAEACWLNEVLPPDAVIVAWDRSAALMPRPFMSFDMLEFSNLEDPVERENVWSLMRFYQANTLVSYFPLTQDVREYLGPFLGKCIAGPKKFISGTRNPWNKDLKSIAAYQINLQLSSQSIEKGRWAITKPFK